MKTIFGKRELILTKEERHNLRSEIWKLVGKPIKGDKTYQPRLNEGTIQVWKERGYSKDYTIEQFRKPLYNKYLNKINNSILDEGQKKTLFSRLNRLSVKYGCILTPIENGYKMVSDPNAKRRTELKQIIQKSQKELKSLG